MCTLSPKSLTFSLLLSLAALPLFVSSAGILKHLNDEIHTLNVQPKLIEEFDEVDEQVNENGGYKADANMEQIVHELNSIGQTVENGAESGYGELTLRRRNHSLILGEPTWRDRLLVNHEVYIPRISTSSIIKLINYPNPNATRPNATIYAIHAVDRTNDGTGAFPRITSGGLGSKDVTMKLTSQFDCGIYFNLKIYGH